MSSLALSSSVLISQDKLNQLGLLFGVDKTDQNFPVVDVKTGQPRPRTIREALTDGANFEDSGFRSINHFFNPLTNRPLSGVPLNATSPDWTLEDNAPIGNNAAGAQNFSYRTAKDYFLNALIKPTKAERDTNWGLTFQTLGQVIHHIQDMAQPQHVRDDTHLDVSDFGLPNVPVLTSPSTYERWVLESKNPFTQYPAYAPVYSASNLGSFTNPRQFWTTSPNSVGTGGNGMAEYTNRGFFSARHLFADDNFPAPVDGAIETVDLAQLCQGVVPACPPGVSGVMSFTHSVVTDTLRPATQDNPRARAFSIYSFDLTSRGLLPGPTLNRFTYDKAAEFLIPRAIGYSAGLLNFFFRGQMEISLPDQGVYAVVDHTTTAGKDKLTGGFSTLKLKIKNTTPGTGPGGIEPTGNGQGVLYAVVKFHKNNCYEEDLSGEYGSPGKDWHTCRATDEEAVVSSPISAPAAIDTSPQQVTFNFPTPIPISATDLFLQVVYRGPLGEETDAVAVATKDISEPTFLDHLDVHDQDMYAQYPAISINGGGQIFTWTQWCQQAIAAGVASSAGPLRSQEDCNIHLWPTKRSLQFSPTNAPIPGWDPATSTVPQGQFVDISQQPALNPAFTLFSPTGSYARVAVLVDAVPTNPAIEISDWDAAPPPHLFSWVAGTARGARNQLDLTTNNLIPTQTWAPARGIYVSPAQAQVIGNPTNPSVGPLVAHPSILP